MAEQFSFLNEMVMFSGYIVARSQMDKSNFHVDFTGTGDSAFTLMTPMYDMSGLEAQPKPNQREPNPASHSFSTRRTATC